MTLQRGEQLSEPAPGRRALCQLGARQLPNPVRVGRGVLPSRSSRRAARGAWPTRNRAARLRLLCRDRLCFLPGPGSPAPAPPRGRALVPPVASAIFPSGLRPSIRVLSACVRLCSLWIWAARASATRLGSSSIPGGLSWCRLTRTPRAQQIFGGAAEAIRPSGPFAASPNSPPAEPLLTGSDCGKYRPGVRTSLTCVRRHPRAPDLDLRFVLRRAGTCAEKPPPPQSGRPKQPTTGRARTHIRFLEQREDSVLDQILRILLRDAERTGPLLRARERTSQQSMDVRPRISRVRATANANAARRFGARGRQGRQRGSRHGGGHHLTPQAATGLPQDPEIGMGTRFPGLRCQVVHGSVAVVVEPSHVTWRSSSIAGARRGASGGPLPTAEGMFGCLRPSPAHRRGHVRVPPAVTHRPPTARPGASCGHPPTAGTISRCPR